MSALSKLEKLMYSIGVVDKASAPVNKIMAKINQLSSQTAGAQDQMMRGFMGAAGGAMMLVGSLNPAIAANQALGEVSSLGVADSSLQQLNNTSINFAAKYGGNAAEVITASYDIQSSFEGITGTELSALTYTSAVMAKGLKSDASTIMDYMGTMKGIYINDLNELGKVKWAEKIAGQTSMAVRMFKTDGNKMASAFSSLGAGAQSAGVDMTESMAILGQLQDTMSGSEAGTKYKAFLAGVGNAQDKLGIKLHDSNNELLPMVDILEALSGKFTNLKDKGQINALKTAFGSEEAVGLIKLLLPQVDRLKNNISELNQQTGMQTATDMANAQTDAWMRLSGGFNAAATSLGQAVLPIIEPVVEVLASMLNGVLWLSQEFPILTGVIATAAVGVVSLIVAMGLLTMGMGLAKYGLIGFSATASKITKLMSLLSSVLGFTRGALIAFQMQVALSGGVFAALSAGLFGATSAAWAFTAALLANPITWVVGAVVLLAAVIYKYWEPIKAFMSGFWDGLVLGFSPVIDVFTALFNELGFVADAFSWVGNAISSVGSWIGELFTPISATSEALNGATNAGMLFGKILGGVFNVIMMPIKVWIMLMTEGISLLKEAAGWVSDLFGSDDVNINANKTIDYAIKNALPENVTAINTPLMQTNVQQQLQAQKLTEQQQSSVKANTVSKYKVEKSAFAQQLSSAITHNSNASTDQSKRVYVDSLTIKSDDAFATSEQLMELAG